MRDCARLMVFVRLNDATLTQPQGYFMRQLRQWLIGSLITISALGSTFLWAQKATEQGNVDVTVPVAFKDTKQIVIGSFKVGFINENKATAKSGGGFFSRDSESRVSLRSKLEGLAPEKMQAIADNIYADFSNKLRSQGYEVLDRSTLTNIPGFSAISGSPSPYLVNGVSAVPQAQALYFAPTGQNVIEFIGEANRAGGLGGLASIGNQISAGNASIKMQEIAEKNKLAIVNVHYIVNFVNAEGSGGYTQKITTVALNQGLTIMPGSSVSIIKGYESTFSTNNGSLKLSKPTASNEQFGEFVETTSSLEKAAGVFSMVTGALSGGRSSNSGEYTVKVNPEAYEKIATELLKTSNLDFASKMASLK
jgi:hypothetical protein